MEGKDEKTLLFDGELAVSIPASYQTMEEEKALAMFPYEERPQLMLEERGTSRFCTFSLLQDQALADNQVNCVIHSIADAVTSLYPSSLLERPRTAKREIGTWGWFAFWTSGREGRLYNMMYVCPVSGSMMLGTLGCPLDDEVGKDMLRKMLRSLEVTKKRPARARISINLPGKRT